MYNIIRQQRLKLFHLNKYQFNQNKKIPIFGANNNKNQNKKIQRKQLNEEKREENEKKNQLAFRDLQQKYQKQKQNNEMSEEQGFSTNNEEKENKKKVMFGSKNPFNTQYSSSDRKDNNDTHFLRYQHIYQEYEKKQQIEKKEQEKYKSHFEEDPDDYLTLDLDNLNIVNIENQEEIEKIPTLQHGLNLVVEHPGIYSIDQLSKLQEDKGEYLSTIYQPHEIDFTQIPKYIPPSQDQLLQRFAKESKIKYIMSTSTVSQVLTQIYYLLCRFKRPDFTNISEIYDNEPRNYMISQRKPVTNLLRKVDSTNNNNNNNNDNNDNNNDNQQQIYAFDSDKGVFEQPNIILMDLGKVSERQFTLTQKEFRKMLLKADHPQKLVNKGESIEDDYHRFIRLNNDICVRSQIDTQQITSDGKRKIFEIKTRACAPMRYDITNYLDYSDYNIYKHRGIHSSFEREYYDLIRGAFLKYSFQLKVGNMDGVFFSYHNTINNFGFEYVHAQEIYKRVFGSVEFSDLAFMVSSKILTNTLDLILKDLEGQKYEQLKIGFFSCCIKQRLITFVELMEEKTDWNEDDLIKPNESIQDEFDYYSKLNPLTNKVYKYETGLYTLVNGIHITNELHDFQPDDQLQVKYKFFSYGQADFADYMSFLHDSYKFDSVNLDVNYAGIWVNLSSSDKAYEKKKL